MNKKIRNNKKSVAIMAYVISILIVILTFFVILKFISNSAIFISSNSDNILCRAYISNIASSKEVKILNFFTNLQVKCKVDRFNIKANSKQELYSKIATEAKSCWFRYGNGNYSFMNNFKTVGNYCFICGDLTFSGSQKGKVYPYNNFISWTQNNSFTQNNKKILYFNYLNLKYLNSSKKKINSLFTKFQTLETNKLLKKNPQIAIIAYGMLQNALFLSSIKIDTNKNLFIVYRYDRIKYSNKIKNAVKGMLIGSLSGMLISTIVVGTIISVVTIGFGAPAEIANIAINTVRITNKADKIYTLIKTITSIVRFSRLVKYGAYGVAAAATVGGVVGGYVGLKMDPNDIQYISIMSPTQYYQTCGTNPVAISKLTIIN